MVKSEILAPCGSFDALTAALRCGADAVYFGAGEFNARRAAAVAPHRFFQACTAGWRLRSPAKSPR